MTKSNVKKLHAFAKNFSYFLRGSGHKSFTISPPSRIDLASAFGYNVKYTDQALLSFRRSGVYYLLSFRGSVSDNPRLGREPGEADRVRKGGAGERAKLSPQGGSGVERTLRRRNPPRRGTRPTVDAGEPCIFSVILAKRGSPVEGHSSTTSLPRQNHPGDSRAERENDSNV